MTYVAIDLGAGSGRVVTGKLDDEGPELEVLHRFTNGPRASGGHQRWDAAALFAGVARGLAALPDQGRDVRSVGVDTWGVDYGLLDARGELVEDPIAYRDPRTDEIPDRVFEVVSRDKLFAVTGLQEQSFNTLYQLYAHVHGGAWPADAHRLLMMPDVIHSWLCGSTVGEYTDATTSQLVNATTRTWDADLFEQLRLPLELMPELVPPGTELGSLSAARQADTGLGALRVIAPATHDTASAVVGTPLRDGWAYISSGTWSLVGIETDAPHLTSTAAAANLTNEGGAYGTNRLLVNVMGLWILESCRSRWQGEGALLSYDDLDRAMEVEPRFQAFIQPDDPRFLHPGDMIEAVLGFLRETGQQLPTTQAGLSRVVLESLAMRYATTLRRIEEASGVELQGVHIIGGGSQNDFLNQATADATGLEVLAGPVEATALGNVLVQAISDGRFSDLHEARTYVARSTRPRRFEPRQRDAWQEASARYQRLEAL